MKTFLGSNGSTAVILRLAEKVPGHAVVKIVKPRGWHKEGDVLVWPLHRDV